MSDTTSTAAEGKLINATSGNEGKLFVGGLAKQTTVESLKAYFQAFGEVKDVSVKIDPHTQQSRGFGFVLFADEASIAQVVEAAPHQLDGRKIDPKKAERRDGKMFVGGVKGETTDDTIIEYFEKFGMVETVDRPVDKATGKNKSFCFVTFKKDGIMKQAVKERFHEIDGKRCETKEGVPKQEMNRHHHEQHHHHPHASPAHYTGHHYGRGGGGGGSGGYGHSAAHYNGYGHHQAHHHHHQQQQQQAASYYHHYGQGAHGYGYQPHQTPHHYRGGHSNYAFAHMNGNHHQWTHQTGWEAAYNPGNRGRGGRGRGRGGGGAAMNGQNGQQKVANQQQQQQTIQY